MQIIQGPKEQKPIIIPNRTEEVRDIIERMPNTFAKYITYVVWIHDPFVQIPKIEAIKDSSNEDRLFSDMMDNNYSSNQTDVTIISFYRGNELSHSVRRDPATGEIWSKTDNAAMEHFNSMEDFLNSAGNRAKYGDETQKKYYKF